MVRYWVTTLRLEVRKVQFKMTKFYNVVSKKIVPKGDSEKPIYHKVGTVKVTTNGGWYLSLYHTDMEFQIFPNHDDELPVIEFGNNEA